MKLPDYGKPVSVARPIRILLGAIIMLAAAFFCALGLYMIGSTLSHAPFKYRDFTGGVLFLALFGVGFGYVALRLMMAADDAPLLGRRASLVAAVCLMGSALFVLVLSALGGISNAWSATVVLPAGVWLWRTAWKRGKHES